MSRLQISDASGWEFELSGKRSGGAFQVQNGQNPIEQKKIGEVT
ncbi:MAG: hypothetical protein ACI92Z_000745 [Paracoccaceae bacterium]|jgi:hypothetical protein